MNFGIEHLYHDSDINNAFTALDAKEKLRTRQINAREEIHLRRYSQSLDRAYTVLVKRQDIEKNNVEKELEIIKLKTPTLDKSLKRELQKENSKYKLPIITSSSNSLIRSQLRGNPKSRTSSNKDSPLHRYSVDLRYSAHSEPTLSTEKDNTPEKVTVYIKKADVVARNLHRLYKRKRERTSYIKQAVDIIRANNQDLLQEARLLILDKNLSHVNKTKVNDELSIASDDINDESNDIVEPRTETNSKTEVSDPLTLTRQDENNNINETLCGKDVEKRLSESECVSSLLVNPSESSSQFDEKNAKWTEIFKIPEMWKLLDSRKKVKKEINVPQALVALRGQLKKTLQR